jgi:hypothetical protein
MTLDKLLTNSRFVSCGLSLKSLRILCIALGHRKTLRHLSIEMNPFKDLNEKYDRELLQNDPVNNLLNTIKVALPQPPEKSVEVEQPVDDKKGGSKVPPKSAPKKPAKTPERKDDFKEELLQQIYFTSPFGPLFCTSAVHISLRGCELNDVNAEQIAQFLADNNTLISLNLFGNNITDTGAKLLGKALLSNQILQSLSLAMNPLTNAGVEDLCKSLCPVELFTEYDFFKLRENVYKSHYGVLNIPREIPQVPPTPTKSSIARTPLPTEIPPMQLPPIPVQLQTPEKKAPTTTKKVPTKQPPQPISTTGAQTPTTIASLEWENRCERIAPPEVIEQSSTTLRKDNVTSRGSSRNVSPAPPKGAPKKGAKVEQPKQEVAVVEEEKPVVPTAPLPLFKVPGNTTLKSLNLSLCHGITDESVTHFLDMLSVNKSLDRLSLACTHISETVMLEIAQKLNETRNQ